jgi:hypothetical protein
MNIEVRYTRSFLSDLRNVEDSAFQAIHNLVFVEFVEKPQLHYLPKLRQIDQEGIFYRFTVDNYLISLELKGEIVKFICIIPMPDV